MVQTKSEMKMNLIIIKPLLRFIKFSEVCKPPCQGRERRNWVPECWTCRKDKWFENSDLRRLQIFWNYNKCKRKLIGTNILISLDLPGRFSALPCASTCGWAAGAAFEGLEIINLISLYYYYMQKAGDTCDISPHIFLDFPQNFRLRTRNQYCTQAIAWGSTI